MKKAAFILVGLCLLGWSGLLGGCASPAEPVQVSTVLAKQADDLTDLSWPGSIEGLRSVDVSPNGSGRVLTIQAVEGQSVKAGDTLFTLDDADLQLALKQAEASSHAAQVAASSAAAAYRENTLVLPAQVARDDAASNYQRLQTLFAAEAVAQTDLDSALSRLQTAEAQLNAAQLNQKSNYENTQAQAAAAQVAVEAAQKRVADCTVKAPIDGLVVQINVEVGAFVSQQTPSITLVDNSGLQVKIQVMESDIASITPNMAMDVYVPALSQTYAGSVGQIQQLGNTKTGMFEVSVVLAQSDAAPRLGLTAEVRVNGGEPSTSVYVPQACVSTEDGQSWVFVVESGALRKCAVTVLSTKNAYLEVEGLNSGDEVVLDSSAALTDGQRVRVIPMLTNQGVGE